MNGEKNLNKLLSTMSPELVCGDFVFLSIQRASYGDYAELQPIVTVSEDEGLTLIVPKSKADEHSHSYESVYRRISLKVHSSLDAVGLTAAVSTKLTENGLSANIIAGYYHDHLFVQKEVADTAVSILLDLSKAY